MSRALKYERKDLAQGTIFCELIVELSGIPCAAFLAPLDCSRFLESLPEYDLERAQVYCNMPERDCYGESVSGERFLEDRRVY